MIVESNWDNFKANFPKESQEYNFELMCYLLFCREFDQDKGIPRFYNHPALETEPINKDGKIIGFQAKFYDNILSKAKQKIKTAIEEVKSQYPELTTLYFYAHQDWTFSQELRNKKTKTQKEVCRGEKCRSESSDKKTKVQKEIEAFALQKGLQIEWKTKRYFDSEFVMIKNSDITLYFFDRETYNYYENIHKIGKQQVDIKDDEVYLSSLRINNENTISGKNPLSNFIIRQLENYKLSSFSNIFVKGVAGIGKSTEMKIAYNALLERCSQEQYFRRFQFLPEPYFFELKNYQEDHFFGEKINNGTPFLFIDGLDELPASKIAALIKELNTIKARNSSCRFILAGRDASFITEMNFDHIDLKLFPYVDDEVRVLMHRFKGTPLESLIQIPFYRNFAKTEKAKSLTTYKDFISALILNNLENDRQRFDWSENKPASIGFASSINLNNLQKNISTLAYNLFKSSKNVFSKQNINDYVKNKEEVFFFMKSSLVEYDENKNISFCSNVYFEYFLAKYYLTQDFALIQKDFFLPTGKVIVHHINIIAILLNLLPTETKLYKRLSKKLNSETQAYILLTDYTLLPVQNRFNFYRKITNEYNADKKTIYYYRFTKTDDILANIDSLADSMHNLLPEDFYNEAVKEHCDVIKKFLKNPTTNELVPFENAVILLGAGNSNWNYEQQEMLKEISIPLLKFFINNEFAEKVKGLLSENTVLRWYDDYRWSENWKEKEWISFVKELTSVENTDFYNFKDEKEYSFKLKLFIHFHNNTFIQKLLVPLAKKILTSTSPTAIASCVPNIIDDNFKTQTVDFNYDIIRFTDVFKKSDVSLSDILQILQIYPLRYHAIPFEAHDLYSEVLKAFEIKIPIIKDENISEFYKVLVRHIEVDSVIHLNDFSKYITPLHDDKKEKVFNLFFGDLMKKTDWQDSRMLARIIILPLLNMPDSKQKAKSLFDKLKNVDSVYKNCITALYYSKDEKHPLYETGVNEYSEVFAEQVKIDKEREKKLNSFRESRNEVFKQEIDVITNKDNSLINEVNRIFEYIDKHPDFSESKDFQGKLFDLQVEDIEQNLIYNYNEECVLPDIFSPFAVRLLINIGRTNLKLNCQNAIKSIEDWFADEKYFWRYFFVEYICNYKTEQVDEFFKIYPHLIDRIKQSMRLELSHCLEDDISMYDGGQNRFWVVPFVYYLTRLYDNKLPDWFDKDKILNFVAYPAWYLSTHIEYDIHVNFEFKWKDWSSVFEWIEEVAGFDKDNIVKKALSLFPKLKNEDSRAQILSAFTQKVKSESVYKNQMLDIIINLTIIEMQKDYNDNNNISINWILSSFWSRTTEDFVARIYSSIDFEKYDLDDKNSCRIAVLEYFCNIATYEQKAKVIETLKNSMDKPNIKIYLAKLGYKKAILAIIDGFLNGDDWNRIWNSSELFMNSTKSFKLLHKCCKLYSYSLEKDCERRELLTGLAKRGIKQNATKWNFWYIRCRLNKEIKKLKKNSLYYEHIQDFLNEIEQRVFSRKLENDN